MRGRQGQRGKVGGRASSCRISLQAIDEVHGIDPRDFDVIVGTSAGSVLGALIGAGVSIDALRDHQRGEPITQGPLAGYLWHYETATGGRRPSMPRLRGPGSVRLMASSLRHGLKMPPTAVLPLPNSPP